MDRVVFWTMEEYKERVAQMYALGLTDKQIALVLECVVIRSPRDDKEKKDYWESVNSYYISGDVTEE